MVKSNRILPSPSTTPLSSLILSHLKFLDLSFLFLNSVLTHAEGAILHIAILTDTVIATNGILTVCIHITHVGTKITFINIWEWKLRIHMIGQRHFNRDSLFLPVQFSTPSPE